MVCTVCSACILLGCNLGNTWIPLDPSSHYPTQHMVQLLCMCIISFTKCMCTCEHYVYNYSPATYRLYYKIGLHMFIIMSMLFPRHLCNAHRNSRSLGQQTGAREWCLCSCGGRSWGSRWPWRAWQWRAQTAPQRPRPAGGWRCDGWTAA